MEGLLSMGLPYLVLIQTLFITVLSCRHKALPKGSRLDTIGKDHMMKAGLSKAREDCVHGVEFGFMVKTISCGNHLKIRFLR